MAAAVNFKMRGSELAGHKGMQRRDITFHKEGVVFESTLPKTETHSLKARPRAAPHLPVEYSMLCASHWLERYLAAVDPEGTMPMDNPLFCELSEAGRWTPRAQAETRVNSATMACLKELGIPIKGLTKEWGRHTGESLHMYKCGLLPAESDLLGDHSTPSTVATLHYRHPSGQGHNILITGYNKISTYAGGRLCCR
jgi:hypothetical protein